MLYVAGVIIVFVGIALSIALHEIGHLVPAKRFGVRVPQYMVGFGPTVWSRRRGETEYGVKAIPLGGYIRMIGMFPPKAGDEPGQVRTSSTGRFSQLADEARAQSFEELRPGDEHRLFYRLSVPKKITVMMGGPLMNLLIAFVLFTGIFTLYGTMQATSTISGVSECVDTTRVGQTAAQECTPDMPAAPANEAGLRPGDTITAINGTPMSSWEEIRAAIRDSAGREMTMVVERAGRSETLTATPIRLQQPVLDDVGGYERTATGEYVTEEVGFLGASPTAERVTQPVTAVPGLFGDMLARTFGVVLEIPQKMVGVYQAAFGGQERDPEGPMSVVGVGRVAGEVASSEEFGTPTEKLMMIVSLLASLNLMLFAFNMLPLLPLDGGHVAGAAWEGLKKTWARVRGLPEPAPVDVAKALPLAYTVAMAFIVMTGLLIYADVVKPIRLL
ncbi:membrane-associated protease RseP (regulator of RpoE activity) [Marihabitans asiaticum]|uniref:Membrane-associated protease RseP (Regulator of RpoE activity) n=2 Tax=Marihabitans asiaticum TaxID=415218 RepID=A0A560W9T5_9MICO|nr:membrane-associated protease RseP (regulator of RpoE activity) [Marihabitans asiaticum]